MHISIITPHYNDVEGLKYIYNCLCNQTLNEWEWIIVDDDSENALKHELGKWYESINDSRVKLINNTTKTNASVCRNIGADAASSNHLVFLDADDMISENFIMHRQVSFTDFAIFINTATIDKNGVIELSAKVDEEFLSYFLKAQFIWPITSILWQKSFFNGIGQFNNQLPRLQDVELAMRALQQSKLYKVVDTPVDFYYKVKPIRERTNFVKPVCEAVYLLISKLLNVESLNTHQKSLLSGYYYMCVRYLERSESTKNIDLVFRNLKLFYNKKLLNLYKYVIGYFILKTFTLGLLSGKQFLRLNRFLFKPNLI